MNPRINKYVAALTLLALGLGLAFVMTAVSFAGKLPN
jgi:hypothetical protein